MSHSTIFFVGALYQDIILHTDSYPLEDSKTRAQKVDKRVGGNSANSLNVLAQLAPGGHWQNGIGTGTTHLEFVGAFAGERDADGTISRHITAHGVSLKYSVIRPLSTIDPTSYILSTPTSRTIISHNDVPELSAAEFIPALKKDIFKSTSTLTNSVRYWFHFEGRNVQEIHHVLDFINTENRINVTVSIEFEKPAREGLADLLTMANVCFFSKMYADAMRSDLDAAAFLLETRTRCKNGAILVLTLGAQGAWVLAPTLDCPVHISAYPPPQGVVDTTGAGDTFIASVIAGLLGGELDIPTAIDVACRVAGAKCGLSGVEGVIKAAGF
ncbi:hypothetical protein SpCBS45565_g08305 [Spizellomyces sp. 'palustris']|nr:hypothetical protein SpCBS45565_g08305 [Spizellomyces sp. 'palustris']